MRAEHIKYFIALAENHSITKTSLEFYTTHQNVSKIIRQLEDEMGAQLFERTPKGMTLTPAGELFLPVARDTLQAFQQVRLDIAHIQRYREMQGLLKLWITPITASHSMRSLIEDFNVLYPKVRYQLNEGNPLDILQYISLHPNALGIVAILHNENYQYFYQPYIKQVNLYPLFKDEYFCFVSVHSPLAKLKHVSFKEFAKHPIAMMQSTDGTKEHPFVQVLIELGKTTPTLTTQSRQLYIHSIASGRFVGIANRQAHELLKTFSDDDMVLVPFEEDLTLDIAFVTNLQPKLDEVSTAFVDMVQERITNTLQEEATTF